MIFETRNRKSTLSKDILYCCGEILEEVVEDEVVLSERVRVCPKKFKH